MNPTSMISIPGFSDPVSSFTHLLAAGAFFIATFFLLHRGRGNWLRVTALGLFSFGLVFLFSMSGVYHLLPSGTTGKIVLQRLDHAAIWTLIGATFTPIHIILFRGFWRWAILLLVWTIAITGLVLKTVFFTQIPELASVGMYIGLGWLGLLSACKITSKYGMKKIRLLLFGGVAYTLGALFQLCQWPIVISGVIGPHEIFHIFVIMGAYCHWKFIYKWSHRPVRDRLTFQVIERPGQPYRARAVGEAIEVTASSLSELRSKIQASLSTLFPSQSLPCEVKLKFFREEVITL